MKKNKCTYIVSTLLLAIAVVLTVKVSQRHESAAGKYIVEFDKNGGTGTMSNQSISVGTATKLTTVGYKRSGYAFLGWSTNANALTQKYTNQQSVTNLTTAGKTIKLYAIWQSNSVVALTDQTGDGSIAFMDMNTFDTNPQGSLIWEFNMSKSSGFTQFSKLGHVDDVKVREPKELGKKVVAFCASTGECGIFEYGTGKCIWNIRLKGSNAHAIEVLPDGYVAIACAGELNGGIWYKKNEFGEEVPEEGKGTVRVYKYLTSTTSVKPDKSAKVYDAHGLVWDENGRNDKGEIVPCLWAYGVNNRLKSSLYRLSFNSKDGSLTREETFTQSYGGAHDIGVDLTNPDRLYCVSSKNIAIFDKKQRKYEEVTNNFPQIGGDDFNGYKTAGTIKTGKTIYSCATREGKDFSYASPYVNVLTPTANGYHLKTTELKGRLIYRAKVVTLSKFATK